MGSRSATELDFKIGENIKASRKLNNVTQEQLAYRLDLTVQQIQKYESGKNRVSASTLSKICSILDISPYELLPIGYASNSNLFSDDIDTILSLYARLPQKAQKAVLNTMKEIASS
tara:strand:+ start:587 stop:934 length:348 start_codon:yes stop_codon:yes gene_type:complete